MNNDNRNASAAEDLKSAESSAGSAALNRAEDSVTGARATEESAGGLYSGGGMGGSGGSGAGGFYSGSGKAPAGGNVNKFTGFMKKRGPMVAILGLVVAFGGLLMGAQTLMPVAIEEMIVEKFNSIGVSSTMTSDKWLNTQLNYGVRLAYANSCDKDAMGNYIDETCEKGNLFGFSEYQVQQFEKQGIKVVNVGGTTTQITALLYRKGNTWIPVVGSDMINYNGLSAAIASAADVDNIGEPVTAEVALNDGDFKVPYTTASKSWRGGSSGWFDNIMDDITETKLAVTRNRWSRFATYNIDKLTSFNKTAASAIRAKTSDLEASATATFYPDDIEKLGMGSFDGEVDWHSSGSDDLGASIVPSTYNEENVAGSIDLSEKWHASTNGDSETMTVKSIEFHRRYDDDGNYIGWDYATVTANNSEMTINGKNDYSGISNALNSKAMKAASAAAAVADGACALLEGIMSIYTVVAAYQNLQFLNLVSGYLEAVDKVKAGDGDESPIHEYSNNLTTRGDTVSVKPDGTGSETELGGATEEVTATKTAMESQGMNWLFGNTKIDNNDPSVQNVNIENIMTNLSSLTGMVDVTAQTYEICGYVKIATSSFNLVVSVLSLIPIFGQAVSAFSALAKLAARVAVATGAAIFFAVAIPVITKKVVNSIIRDAATEWFGEDLGNALVSGASKYLGGNGTAGGQSPASKEVVTAYLGARDTVIAEEAEYQRAIRSPFDISSPYTFLGSLAYAVMPMAYSGGGVLNTLTNVSDLTSNSIVAMMPTVSAANEIAEITSEGDCALLGGMGIVGDAFCNAYIVTDTSTINYDPEAVINAVHEDTYNKDYKCVRRDGDSDGCSYVEVTTSTSQDNLNRNFENGKILKNSNLAKYITYCGQRTSQYGIRDATIADQVQVVNSDVSSILGVIPVIGDAMNVLSSSVEAGNFQWITGEACVASNDNEYWSENKWYQRYAENERLLENIDPGYTSTVTAYLREYYEENPLDTSLEGTIARFSGMSKEKVEDTLALMNYYMFLDEYDASAMYAFGEKYATPEGEKVAKTVEHDLNLIARFDLGTVGDHIYNIWFKGAEFAETRNRAVSMV